MDYLSRVEEEKNIILPQIYKDFYYSYTHFSIPEELVGTDLFSPKHNELNEWALELLEEIEIDNFLEEDDFVFMIHQGYMFWYFKADGNADPDVYAYFENKLTADKLGPLSQFLNQYIR